MFLHFECLRNVDFASVESFRHPHRNQRCLHQVLESFSSTSLLDLFFPPPFNFTSSSSSSSNEKLELAFTPSPLSLSQILPTQVPRHCPFRCTWWWILKSSDTWITNSWIFAIASDVSFTKNCGGQCVASFDRSTPSTRAYRLIRP